MSEEFSVWIFFGDGFHFAEGRWLSDKEAVELAADVIRRPAAQAGIIVRVIITDNGDFTNFEWKFGEGVTYPPKGDDGKFYVPAETTEQ